MLWQPSLTIQLLLLQVVQEYKHGNMHQFQSPYFVKNQDLVFYFTKILRMDIFGQIHLQKLMKTF